MPTRFNRRDATTENRGRMRIAGEIRTGTRTGTRTIHLHFISVDNPFFAEASKGKWTEKEDGASYTRKLAMPVSNTYLATQNPNVSAILQQRWLTTIYQPLITLITPITQSPISQTNIPTPKPSPFGVMLENRQFQAEDYRYGFQGQEMDDDIKGNGNSINFLFRMCDPRLGKFLSIDPLAAKFPSSSPFSFSENCPIRFIELEGKEIADPELFELAMIMLDQYESDIASGKIDNATVFNGITKTEVIRQLKSKLQNPNGVGEAQNLGYFCGTAATMVVSINYNPMAYVSTVMDLVSTGQAAPMGGVTPTLVVPEWAKTLDLSSGETSNGVLAVDYIIAMTLRSSENEFISAGEDLNNSTPFHEGTWPSEMKDMFQRMGIDTKHSTFYLGQNNRSLKKIEKAVEGGYRPVVFEDHRITVGPGKDNVAKTIGNLNFGIHYIVITEFKLNKDKTVTFSYSDYGKETKNVTMSIKDFKKGMKGYWIPKNKEGAGGQEKTK